MDESGGAGKLKMMGAVIGAAFLVASGGYGLLHFQERPPIVASDSDVLQRILEKLSSIEQTTTENRHRIEALERPGGTTPMARETRERFEAVDRVLGDTQRALAANTQRLDALLMERRGRP